MSSEKLGHNNNVLQETLGGGFNILTGSSGEYTDLGIARRFGGSAAAYSLRDIGAMNGRVVKVRRDVDGDGTDKEEDFSASQVQSGALEDFVNGKLENTLPADVDTAAAAYSLRKVKASYAEDAVRIRRTSDSTEVDVAFDSDDKVSSSSAVTDVAEQGGESGSTNATDLNGFLNEEHDITNTSSTLSNKSVSGVQGTTTDATFNSIDFTVTALENSGGSATDNMWLFKLENHNQPSIGKIRISVDCTHFDFENGGNVDLQPLYDHDGDGSNSYANAIRINGTGSYSVEIDLTTRQTTQAFRFFKGDVALGDRIRVENLKIESLKSMATVHTWYDQAGSNDATQTTAANQPVIAENGVLLTDGLSFDGDLFLQKTTTDTTTAASIFGVYTKGTSAASNARPVGYQEGDSSGTNSLAFAMDNTLRFDGTSTSAGSQTIPASGLFLSTTIKVSNTEANHFLNSVSNISNSSLTLNDTDVRFSLGFANTTPAYDFDGNIKEAIFYTSDQSDNRFKIESNINNYYALYTFQGDGFVETWYDQSGNGNNATQGTAGNQPKIVESGSLVSNANGFPSIKFESANSTELAIGNLMSNLNSVSAYAVTQKDDTDSNVAAGLNQGSSSDNSRFFLPFYTSSTAPKFGYHNSAAKINFGTVSTGTCNMYSVFSGDTNIEAFLNGSSVGTTTLVDQSVTLSTSKLGQISNTFRFDGLMSEIYLTTNKLQDDASDINRDVTNYYNL